MALTAASTETEERVSSIVRGMRDLEGPLLPILHAVQADFGHVPAETLPLLASALDLSRAEVHGVVTFYHDFRAAPAGRHVLKLCRAEACQAMGADAVAEHVRGTFGIGLQATAPDGSLTIEPVYCLGLCACAPAALFDGEPIGRLDAAGVDEIAARVRG